LDWIFSSGNVEYQLLQDVLAEVPYQVAEYMTRKGYKPGVPDVSTVLRVEQMNLRR
jgi:hypothetical protein